MDLAIIALVALAPGVLSAQADRDSVQLRNDCRLASQIVSRGTPDQHRDWALSTIRHCGADGATALVQALRSLRSTRDTSILDQYFGPTRVLRDRKLLDFSTELATDERAAPEARVFAIRTLIWFLNPGLFFGYSELAGDEQGRTNCAGSFTTHVHLSKGDPLPVNYADQVNVIGRTLSIDRTVPVEVRRAAGCAWLLRATPWLEEWEQES